MKKQILLCSALALIAADGAFARTPKKRGGPSQQNQYSSSASSAGGHRMAGCGLGSLAIEDSSKWAQVGAAFLNGTGFQTFGITFGTSNCTEDGLAAAAREKDAFVEANLQEIRRDLSVGSGDYLASLASLYGCEGEKASAFGSALSKHQSRLEGASPEQASGVIDGVVAEEKAACTG